MGIIELLTKDNFKRGALETGGPVALDFYQKSCPPCHVLEPRLERVAHEFGDRLTVYRVDIDQDMAIAERFGVRSLPTVLLLRDGREVERLDGLIREDALRRAFDQTTR